MTTRMAYALPRIQKRNRLSSYYPALYWIGLILGVYYRFAEVYIAIVFAIVFIFNIRNVRILSTESSKTWSPFLLYYLFATLIGFGFGTVGLAAFVEFFLKYLAMPFTVYFLLPRDFAQLSKPAKMIRSFIVISAVYGLIESIIGHNYLYEFITIPNKQWIIQMNSAGNYQCSSIYLHYGYYGFALLLCWIMLDVFPFKKAWAQRLSQLLVIEQLLACQSRIAWIAFVVVLLMQFLLKKPIVSKKGTIVVYIAGFVVLFLLIDPGFFKNGLGFISDRFSSLFSYGLSDGSLGQRLGTLMNWPIYFSNNVFAGIFGTGYASVNGLYLHDYSMFTGYSTVDSEITVYLIEVGVVGFLVLVFAVGRTLLQPACSSRYSLLTKLVIAAGMVEGITLDFVSNNVVFGLFIIALILGLKGQELSKQTGSPAAESLL